MSPFEHNIQFITELARRLHVAGVTSSRLEGAVRATAIALGISCEIWSTPTGLLLSLSDAQAPQGATQHTRMLRLEPGNIDFSALVALDTIADRVIAGDLTVDSAFQAMAALDRPVTRTSRVLTILAFGIAAAAVAGLLRTGWLDIAVAGSLGLVIGLIGIQSKAHPHVGAAFEAIAAIVATVAVGAFTHYLAPLSVQTVIIAALVVLMPGLSLTTAVTELASQQLVSGTARFAGAMVVLLKLTFGSVAGAQIVTALGWTPRVAQGASLPAIVEIVAAVAASISFAMLFRTRWRDVPLVVGSALVGYVLTRAGAAWLGLGASAAFAGPVFFASLSVGALSNLYGRLARRPGALVRVPGIMLMVPGSVGFRGLSSIMERDYTLGLDTGVAVVSALVALMAGLLFGSLLVPPRRHL